MQAGQDVGVTTHWTIPICAATSRAFGCFRKRTTGGQVFWRDLGDLLPDGFAPGTREWAGSSVFDLDSNKLTLYFTSTGRQETPMNFEQRVFETHARLSVSEHSVTIGD